MLVVALQFYTGDWYRAMKLAELMRSLESRRRRDVALLFVRTTELHAGRFIDEEIARCSEIFPTESVVLGPDTPERRERWGSLSKWPVGCNVLWQGTVDHFLDRMDPRWTSIFTVDGGDSAPVCRDWLDVLVEDHGRTLVAGKQVTGWVSRDGFGRWHANLNCVYERSFFAQYPEVREMPAGADTYEPIDMYRREAILSACRASSSIFSSWRTMGVGPAHFAKVAEKSAWWHGCKDGDFVEKARGFVSSLPRGYRPAVEDLGPASAMSAAGEVAT